MAESLPEIVEQLKSRALAGDLGAIRLILERLVAPLKAAEQPAPINLPAGASLADTGRAMIAAAGEGTLTPGQAAQLLSALGALVRVIEVDELEKRIVALESQKDSTDD